MQVERRKTKPAALQTLAVVIVATAVNVALSMVNEGLNLPFFLDAIGTAIAAVTVGLFPALAVAIGTNVIFEFVYAEMPLAHFPFVVCGIATALILWAFKRSGSFSTIGHALLASLAVALANAALGGLIAALVFGGVTGVGIDYLVAGLVAGGRSVLSASFWARVPANLVDKTIAVFIAFFVQEPLQHLHYKLSLRRLPQ